MLDFDLIFFPMDFGLGIPGSVLNFAPGLLGFSFDLLRGTFDLGIGVACPFSYLTPGASGRVINSAFYLVLIHHCVTSGEYNY
jgi:hypothetical protein